MKLSSRISSVAPSATLAISSRAKKLKQSGVDVVSFGAGEPDFDTPQTIKDSAIQAINNGFTKYTPASGTLELKEAIAEEFKRFGLDYEPKQIVISCGAKHSLYNLLQVLCESGDEVAIISPYWVSYSEMVKLSDAKPVIITTKLEDGFKVSLDQLKENISKKTKLLILNSPSNPAGVVYSRDELEAIAKLCLEKDILVISDEIYSEILYDGIEHVSIGSLGKEILANTITVNGVSKSYSMTGWRIGYFGADAAIADAVNRLQSHSTSNPTSISQKAALKALKDGQKSTQEMLKAFVERREYICSRLDAIEGVKYFKPQGAFYVFCDISHYKLGSDEFASRLLDEANVALVPGKSFGHDNFVRISFATSMENIKKGLDRIVEFVGKL